MNSDSKRFKAVPLTKFDGDAASALEYYIEEENKIISEGFVVQDTRIQISTAGAWLFSCVDDIADSYSISSRQVLRALSPSTDRVCSDPDLSLNLSDAYRVTKKRASDSADGNLRDLLKQPSGYYPDPSEDFMHNKPTLSVYPEIKNKLVNIAKITGDTDWSVVALSNLGSLLCEFAIIEGGRRKSLKEQEKRRLTFLRWRYGALSAFVPDDSSLWLRTELERAIKSNQGMRLSDLAVLIGYPIEDSAVRKQRLIRATRRLVRDLIVVRRGSRYYPAGLHDL